jgi:glycerophosphoryl diester phosphodiesterase
MRTPWIIAHRGASGHAPENTFAAFERAVELGAGFIETDLQLTRDAQFVAIHDGYLDRTTNGQGPVSDHTLAELRQLDAGKWFDRQFMDQRIPTLDEILQFARERDIVFYLEIKQSVTWGMHQTLAGVLGKAQNAAHTIVISFDPATLNSVRRLEPAMMTGLLVAKAKGDSIQAALEVGARQICPHVDLLTREMVERAHRADLHVVTWTVNDADKMRAAMDAGVDGIMTDLPDRLRAVVEDSFSNLSSK